MSSLILIFSPNTVLLKDLETALNFIDVNFIAAENYEELKNILASGQKFNAALVYSDNTDTTSKIYKLIQQSSTDTPLYFLDDEFSMQALPAKLNFTGTIKLPLKYQNLQSILNKAKPAQKITNVENKQPTLSGSSPQMKEIQTLVRHVSKTDANVLILGESGTGKEVVARSIHSLSLRNDRPFVAVNCGAIPSDLLESELFGHEKGSFTGAINMRKGRFELAEGGTLFLDEIGDMPYEMQVKLLRVIQEKTFERVGGTKSITSNVRIVAATHQDLEKKITDGKFRMDLYYRLNVFPIELEPLRNRPDDVEFLINEFLARMKVEYNIPIAFEDSAVKALQSHSLMGNVRELENLVERLGILYPGETITCSKLPERYQPGNSHEISHEALAPTVSVTPAVPEVNKVQNLKEYLSALEKSIIEQALDDSNGIVAKAAKSLSLQRTTLVEKIKKLEIHQTA